MRAARSPLLALVPILIGILPAEAACDVAGVRLEEVIAQKQELRAEANEQTVRDLRTLRDAAIVLDAYSFGKDCARLVAIVKALSADPETTIGQGSDTDEAKAEAIARSREPKGAVEPKVVAEPK